MNRTVRATIVAIAAIALLIVLYVATTTHRPVEVDSGQRVVMGTFSRIVVIAKDEQAARDCIMAAYAEQCVLPPSRIGLSRS